MHLCNLQFWIMKLQKETTKENLPSKKCTTDETQRAGILSHPWSVHSIASRQKEAGYQLEYGKHII